jgi:hypothetical protein
MTTATQTTAASLAAATFFAAPATRSQLAAAESLARSLCVTPAESDAVNDANPWNNKAPYADTLAVLLGLVADLYNKHHIGPQGA